MCSSDLSVHAQESSEVAPEVVVREGPSAAFEFEKSFRDANRRSDSKPIDLQQCENITKLHVDFWSKKHVLTDFKKRRTVDQIGVIVIVKTELCCRGSRLCAVTTACMEKKSTPLVRSQEHTSELQSRRNLVCRLLLEKKKNSR